MTSGGDRLQAVLEGYSKFLLEKNLAPPRHQPYLVRWVRDFLLFAQEHGGYTFEQTMDLFLAEVGGRVGVKPWQIQQAGDAVRIYGYQYRGASDDGEGGIPAAGLNDNAAMLARLGEVIRLRHYAKSTEKTYLHWTWRFLEYRRGAGCEGAAAAEAQGSFGAWGLGLGTWGHGHRTADGRRRGRSLKSRM